MTCKIRLLESVAATVEFARVVEATGVAAVAVHARFTSERPHSMPHYDMVRAVTSALRIPVSANGGSHEIHRYDDLRRVQEACGALGHPPRRQSVGR